MTPEITEIPWAVVGAFAAPILVMFGAYALDAFSGYKTDLSAGFSGVVAGMEVIEISFIPAEIATALVSGSAFAALIANSKWVTKRK